MVSTILGAIRDAARRLARFLRRREESNAFVAFHTATVPAGGTITLHLANPTSERLIDVKRFLVATRFKGQYRIYDQFDGDVTGGNSVGIDNLRMDSAGGPPDSGAMAAAEGVTFTATGTHFHAVTPGGGPGGKIGGKDSGTEPIIDPGREIVLELQNDGTEDLGTVAVVYTERDMR